MKEPFELLSDVGGTFSAPRRAAPVVSGSPGGYGTDPNLVTPSTPWPRTLTLYEQHLIAALSDVILPGTSQHPAPSKIGIEAFFDEWLSAPYSPQTNDKALVLPGLNLLDDSAKFLFKKGFLQLSGLQKRKTVDALIKDVGDGRKFFVRFRYLVVGAYFTSDPGLRAIGYIGNVPLQEPPRVSPSVKRTIDRKLRELGL